MRLKRGGGPAPAPPPCCAPPPGCFRYGDLPEAASQTAPMSPSGSPMPRKSLKKIPFFVRGKAKRNTEKFRRPERGVTEISVDTLYEAKAHYAR